MSRITNWNQTERRNATDVLDYSLSGTVRVWEHDETGDTVAVRAFHESEGADGRFYNVEYNGEAVTARDTLNAAVQSATKTLREKPEGLDADGDH